MWTSVRPRLHQWKRYLPPLQRVDNKRHLLYKPPVRATFNVIGQQSEGIQVQPEFSILTRTARLSALSHTVRCYTSLVSSWRPYSTVFNQDSIPGTTANESVKTDESSTVAQEHREGEELEHSCGVATTRTNQISHDSTVPCEEESDAVVSLTCSGCGALLQPNDPKSPGFIPKPKYQELESLRPQQNPTEPSAETEAGVEGFEKPPLLVCQRCFSLKHYNTALNITLRADDYLRHLGHLKEKRALILLMIDVVDFPGSLFPDLNALISPTNSVVIVANKVDLLPKHLGSTFFQRFESMIINEPSLAGCKIAKVYFISAKSGRGVEQLSEDIVNNWGNRGDIYLLGCTNVGKSSLFNRLLATLCGARPGDLTTESNVSAPAATISQWPGTTLGLLRFPLMSAGKRRRLVAQARKMKEATAAVAAAREEEEVEEVEEDVEHYDSGDHEESVAFDEDAISPRQAKRMARALPEMEDVLVEIGLRREPRKPTQRDSSPQNRFWLHDTPGAINDAQLINLLTTKELNLALPKKSLRPRTFILQPGQCMLLGGLARLDYCKGPTSAYFTVFAASYLPVHTTKVDKADRVHSGNLGNHLLKIPFGDEDRLRQFPQLESREIFVTGRGWKESSADVVLSSAGWVAVTIDRGHVMTLRAHTPGGRGIFQRQPSLISEAVNERGKRSQKGNRATFTGRKGRRRH